MSLIDLCQQIVVREEVSDDDVLALRQNVFEDVVVTIEEVEALCRIDESVERRVPAWRAFFLEALTDWLVRQQEPTGYVTQDQATWLIARLEADRRVRDETELELVIRVLEQAEAAPSTLAAFGLRLVTRSVLARDGVISREDVERMRRLMFAPTGPGGLSISREEADALLDLNDATRGVANDPTWTDFFKRAVGNAVTAAAGWAAPGREEALRRENWLADPKEGILRAYERKHGPISFTGPGIVSALTDLYALAIREMLHGKPDDAIIWERLEANAAASAAAAPVDTSEARWLIDRIGQDGHFDENERALILFLRDIAPQTDKALEPLIARLAA